MGGSGQGEGGWMGGEGMRRGINTELMHMQTC